MKLILNIILLLFVWSSNAQNINNKKRITDLSISFSGFGGDYITNSSGIQMGMELGVGRHTSIQCDLRYIFNVPNQRNNGYFIINVDKMNGFLIGLGIKEYASKLKNELRGGYVGGKVTYLYTDSFRDNYSVYRHKTGLYGIIGWKYITNHGFLFEVNTGVGIQVIISRNSNIDSNTDYYFPVEFPWSKPYVEGKGFYPDFTCNLKIGWRIK